MTFSNDLNWEEVKETPFEAQVNDAIEEWHLNYTGEMSLSEFLAWYMNWTLMQSNAWLSGKGFNA